MGDLLEALNPTNGPVWLIAGVALVILEALGGHLAFLSLGVGAVFTGVLAFFGFLELWALLLVFAVSSLVTFLLARRISSSWHTKGNSQSNYLALVGREAVVVKDIPGPMVPGYVKIAGEEWRAVAKAGWPLTAGQRVVVLGVEGVTLLVEKDS